MHRELCLWNNFWKIIQNNIHRITFGELHSQKHSEN